MTRVLQSADLDSTLDENWGILLCSNDNGHGTYEGYYDRHGDISRYFQNWGEGTIATGGTWACEYDTSCTSVVNPTEPEATAGRSASATPQAGRSPRSPRAVCGGLPADEH